MSYSLLEIAIATTVVFGVGVVLVRCGMYYVAKKQED